MPRCYIRCMIRYEIIPYDSALYHETVAVRDAILRQPLGMRIRPEDVADDATRTHFAAVSDGMVIACISAVHLDAKRMKLRQMAVAAETQGKGIGAALVRFAHTWAREQGYKQITLNARTSAQGFYEKLGYETHGERFEEVGVEHIEMRTRF